MAQFNVPLTQATPGSVELACTIDGWSNYSGGYGASEVRITAIQVGDLTVTEVPVDD